MSNRKTNWFQPFIGAASAALMLLWPTTATAQVGHSPESSPYRDLRGKYVLSVLGGYATGSGGKPGVGPTDGPLGGVRLDIHLNGPIAAAFDLWVGSLDRLLINPDEAPENRILGTAKQSIFFVDAGLDLVFTGQKTWHGLAPYFGASLGLALGGEVPEDTSGFQFSTKFMVGPRLGLRWHPLERFSLRMEARDMLWRLAYPSRFFSAPALAPDSDPVLDSRTTKPNQWTHHPMFLFSLGYAIRL